VSKVIRTATIGSLEMSRLLLLAKASEHQAQLDEIDERIAEIALELRRRRKGRKA
jgi:hypothetical protein